MTPTTGRPVNDSGAYQPILRGPDHTNQGRMAAHSGWQAFFPTAPVTQRHTVDWHHLKADLRSSTGWTGLEAYGPLVEVHIEAASSGGTGTL